VSRTPVSRTPTHPHGAARLLRDQLERMEARVRELRTARSAITYDLEWAVKESGRLRRHLEAAARREEGAA
jgi:hypothetical protein